MTVHRPHPRTAIVFHVVTHNIGAQLDSHGRLDYQELAWPPAGPSVIDVDSVSHSFSIAGGSALVRSANGDGNQQPQHLYYY